MLTEEEIFNCCPNKCVFMRTQLKRLRKAVWLRKLLLGVGGRWGTDGGDTVAQGVWCRAPGRAGGEEEEEEDHACGL